MQQCPGAESVWQAGQAPRCRTAGWSTPTKWCRAVALLSSDESGLMEGSMVEHDQSLTDGCDSAPMSNAPL